MLVVNDQDQKNRRNSLKQGEKEFTSIFKLRFDNQVKANKRTGVVQLSEAVREIDILCSVGYRIGDRCRAMLAMMGNSILYVYIYICVCVCACVREMCERE
jgi:hypothetical protein